MNKKNIILIICAIFVVLAGVAIFFISQGHFGSEGQTQATTRQNQLQRVGVADSGDIAISGKQSEAQSQDSTDVSRNGNELLQNSQTEDKAQSQSSENAKVRGQRDGSAWMQEGFSGNGASIQRFDGEGFSGVMISAGDSRHMAPERMNMSRNCGGCTEVVAGASFLITIVLVWTMLVLGIISLFKYLKGK